MVSPPWRNYELDSMFDVHSHGNDALLFIHGDNAMCYSGQGRSELLLHVVATLEKGATGAGHELAVFVAIGIFRHWRIHFNKTADFQIIWHR